MSSSYVSVDESHEETLAFKYMAENCATDCVIFNTGEARDNVRINFNAKYPSEPLYLTLNDFHEGEAKKRQKAEISASVFNSWPLSTQIKQLANNLKWLQDRDALSKGGRGGKRSLMSVLEGNNEDTDISKKKKMVLDNKDKSAAKASGSLPHAALENPLESKNSTCTTTAGNTPSIINTNTPTLNAGEGVFQVQTIGKGRTNISITNFFSGLRKEKQPAAETATSAGTMRGGEGGGRGGGEGRGRGEGEERRGEKEGRGGRKGGGGNIYILYRDLTLEPFAIFYICNNNVLICKLYRQRRHT